MGVCRVTFTSGATVEFDAESVEWKQRSMGGVATDYTLNWDHSGQRQPLHLNLANIDAIVFDHGSDTATEEEVPDGLT